MKWIIRIVIAVVVLVAAVVAYAMLTALGSERPVGFQIVQTSGATSRPVAMGVWYPTDASARPTTLLPPLVLNVARDGAVAGKGLPLVVISHGNMGGPGSHADLAMALASAGYVVAAPMHTGDNYADQAAAGSASLYSTRNKEVSATIDHMLKAFPQIDPLRVGAFGFSAGGFTVLTSIGAQPDMRLIARHCARASEFVCDVLKHDGSPLLKADAADTGGAFQHDARIKAAVVAAPGLGFTLVPDGLVKVGVPVQLWSGDADDKVPFATNAKLIRDALGARLEYHAVAGAGHASFLAPCGLIGPPVVCADPGQFDRKAFHAVMNASVIGFFDKHLATPSSVPSVPGNGSAPPAR